MLMTRRVLLIAPRKSNLPAVDQEVQSILNSGLEVKTLIGKIEADDVIREIRDGAFDILWLSTHGDDSGVELSEGERLDAAHLVPQVKGKFSLVILNTCRGLGIAQMLQEEANVAVICSPVGIEDNSAYHFGARLATALVDNNSIVDAYLASKPGHNQSYLYLSALKASPDYITTLVTELHQFRAEMEREREEMTLYRESLDKDRRWRWRLIIVLLALQPITWLMIYLSWRF